MRVLNHAAGGPTRLLALLPNNPLDEHPVRFGDGLYQ